LLADQPELTTNHIEHLSSFNISNLDLIISTEYNKGPGVPVCFPRCYFKELMQLQSKKGAKAILNAHLNETKVIALDLALTGIDTP
jgi:molybdenum cofactor cytidylyltransferase